MPSHRPSQSPQSRPPVVTVACPSCGGVVHGSELGTRTQCRYCGIDLHLPLLAPAPAPRVLLPGEVTRDDARSRATRESSVPTVITCLVLAGILGLAVAFEEKPAQHRTRAPTPQAEQQMNRTTCLSGCKLDCVHDSEVMRRKCDDCRKRCNAQ